VEHLSNSGVASVETISESDPVATAVEKTRSAMERGVDVIVQATLASGRWFGRADSGPEVSTDVDHSAWDIVPGDIGGPLRRDPWMSPIHGPDCIRSDRPRRVAVLLEDEESEPSDDGRRPEH